jgi:hypothetical protein
MPFFPSFVPARTAMSSRLSIFLLYVQMQASTRLARSAASSQNQPRLEAQIQPTWARIRPHAHWQRRQPPPSPPPRRCCATTPAPHQRACRRAAPSSSSTTTPANRAHPHQPPPHASSPSTGGSQPPPPPRQPAPRRRGPEQPSRRPGIHLLVPQRPTRGKTTSCSATPPCSLWKQAHRHRGSGRRQRRRGSPGLGALAARR